MSEIPPDFFVYCLTKLSFAPALEPLAGAALAINLAYVNLERFRYRTKIRDHSRLQLKNLSDGDGALPDHIVISDAYKQVERLASLPNNDDLDEGSSKKEITAMPSEIWGMVYTKLFENHQDKYISYLIAATSTVILAMGVAHSIKRFLDLSCYFSYENSMWVFWWLIFSMIAPVILVITGRKIVAKAKNFAAHSVKELKNHMKGAAEKAEFEPTE